MRELVKFYEVGRVFAHRDQTFRQGVQPCLSSVLACFTMGLNNLNTVNISETLTRR